jgi:hypothetical protein
MWFIYNEFIPFFKKLFLLKNANQRVQFFCQFELKTIEEMPQNCLAPPLAEQILKRLEFVDIQFMSWIYWDYDKHCQCQWFIWFTVCFHFVLLGIFFFKVISWNVMTEIRHKSQLWIQLHVHWRTSTRNE